MLDYKAIMASIKKKRAGVIETTCHIISNKSSKAGLKLLESPDNPIFYESINNFYRNFGDYHVNKDYWEKVFPPINVLSFHVF